MEMTLGKQRRFIFFIAGVIRMSPDEHSFCLNVEVTVDSQESSGLIETALMRCFWIWLLSRKGRGRNDEAF